MDVEPDAMLSDQADESINLDHLPACPDEMMGGIRHYQPHRDPRHTDSVNEAA